MLARSKSAMKAPPFSHAVFMYGYKLIFMSRGDWFYQMKHFKSFPQLLGVFRQDWRTHREFTQN